MSEDPFKQRVSRNRASLFGYQEIFDETHQRYFYFNPVTKESTWYHPKTFMQAQQQELQTHIPEPVQQQPVVQPVVQPIVQQPIIQQPVIQQPIVQETIVKQPQPVVNQKHLELNNLQHRDETRGAFNLPNYQISEARQIFEEFDHGGSGKILFSDLRELLETLIHETVPSDLWEQYMIMQFTTTRLERDVEWDEFLALFAKVVNKETPPQSPTTPKGLTRASSIRKKKREPCISEQYKAVSALEPNYAYNTFSTKEKFIILQLSHMCSKAEPELMELELQQNTFLWAVLKGDLNTVESSAKSASAHLFLDFALKATLPSYKLTTLHLAVASGNLQLVNFFIKDGSYLQLIDKPALNNLSPLHIACTFGLLEIAQILIDNGGYPETVASAYPYFKQDSSAQRVIDFWLKNGATPSCTPILLAALSGHLEVVQFLLERKCYAAQEMNRMKGYLSDPVSCSIVAQSEKLLKFLLDTLPYDFNIVDRMGMTPLLLVAYACNNSKITELLMLKGANISVINPNNGNSAIHYAVMMGHESFVETLCNAKKNSEELQIAVNLTNVLQPNTPLQLASQIQDEETRERISSLLRANGATEKKMYSEIVKEGYLTKEGHVVKNWKKRWFVLKKGSLCYFASIEKLKNETGVISLENAILEDASDKKKPFCFAITDNVKNKKYYIQAPNETEKKDWFQALEYAIGK